MMDRDRITTNPKIMGGNPCIRDMRVTVKCIIDLIRAEIPEGKILEAYPYLEKADLRAAQAFAEDSIYFTLVPQDKHDHQAVERAIAAGYPAVEPVLPLLLEWVQDMNWPVAQTLTPFLASIGTPLIPHMETIFLTDDHIWKAWVISHIIEESEEMAGYFKGTLEKLATQPAKDKDDEWLRENAETALRKFGWL